MDENMQIRERYQLKHGGRMYTGPIHLIDDWYDPKKGYKA